MRSITHKTPCARRSAFRWMENSCYMDSVLWVLLNSFIPFVDRKLLSAHPEVETLHEIGMCGKDLNDLNERIFMEFQTQLKTIAEFFRTGKGEVRDCRSFRQLYKRWHEHPRCHRMATKIAFHEPHQQEAHEFLQFLLALFGMNGLLSCGAVSSQTFHYGVSIVPRTQTHWEFIEKRSDRRQSLVWSVSFQALSHAPPTRRSISDFFSQTDEIWNLHRKHKKCNYNAIRTTHTLDRFADLLVVSIDRVHPQQGAVLHRRLGIDPFVVDRSGKRLDLVGIICHHGETHHAGHYTAFGLCRDGWFFYDDLQLPIKKIGTLTALFSIRSIQSHGILYFYARVPQKILAINKEEEA